MFPGISRAKSRIGPSCLAKVYSEAEIVLSFDIEEHFRIEAAKIGLGPGDEGPL
jgi:hypothetical protein